MDDGSRSKSDERKRSRPKVLIIEMGLHPHPGPRLKELDWGFDNLEWDQFDEDFHDVANEAESSDDESGPDAAWYEDTSGESEHKQEQLACSDGSGRPKSVSVGTAHVEECGRPEGSEL